MIQFFKYILKLIQRAPEQDSGVVVSDTARQDHGVKHLAMIMDGNRRWAKANGVPTLEGHRQGARALEKMLENCLKSKIQHLTVYAFSTENWRRAQDEVNGLMGLMRHYLDKRIQKIKEHNIRVRIIGDYSVFAPDLVRDIDKLVLETKDNTALEFTIALNYGSRQEIAQAARVIAGEVQQGQLEIVDIDEAQIEKHLMTNGLPDPDLLIRTSGESRLSNYLLWQLSYSELYFTETLWPDFDDVALQAALDDYKGRHRRYGGN